MHRQPAHAPHLELNGIRIAGTSAAIALHAIVLMMLLTPTQWVAPKVDVPVDMPVPLVDIRPKRPIEVMPIKEPIKQKQTPIVRTPVKSPAPPQEVVSTEPSTEMATPDTSQEIIAPTSFEEVASAELSVTVAPTPPYPAIALREGITGKVMLRITVDAQGRPIDGAIEKSSGSRLLDQTALKFVLAHWHFNPAIQGGTAIESVALIPIVFTLDR